MKNLRPRPLTLIILDGWGYREETEANAIAAAYKPNWDKLWLQNPHGLISGSGRSVGLPDGQMGNSEVGHMNMGAGRIVHQDLTRIDLDIETDAFFANKTLISALQKARASGKAVHLMGLLSPGGVHSHENHFRAMLDLAHFQQITSLYIHAFLDGRDTPPKSAMSSLASLHQHCQQRCGQIASILGRYYAMDRDQRWDRVQAAYELLANGRGNYQAVTAMEGLQMAYDRGETDEFVKATSIHENHVQPISMQDGDVVIFMNFRADRAREITQAFIDPVFHHFVREHPPKLGAFVCLTEYDKRFLWVDVAYPPQSLHNILAEYLSGMGLTQLRIAETEKYAHVTFFFNGGVESPFPGEDRILIPSPKVATYDLQPEMSAYALTERLVHEIKTQRYDMIVCNFANPDMVGHTGDMGATIKAIETIDDCLGKIIHSLHEVGGEALITADHGNAEKMYDFQTNQPHTAHTSDPVPLIYVGRKAEMTKRDGKLSDIAPTLLYLMNLPKPEEMSGQSLVKLV